MKNVIIITTGGTGSSILAGLISRKRYYINAGTIDKRKDYPHGDYENPELIQMNKTILQEAGYDYKSLRMVPRVDIERIAGLAESGNTTRYREFIVKCEKEGPWLWKDPRLLFTIFFWKHLLDMNNIHFIILSRDPYQIFRSVTKHYISCTKPNLYRRLKYRLNLIEKFITDNHLQVLRLDYSELWKRDILNNKLYRFMGINISEDDYRCVVKPITKKEELRITFLKRYYYGILRLLIRRIVRGY